MLAAISAFGPLCIDLYLPALSDIADHYRSTIEWAEYSISIFFLGFGIGQLVGGPLSDNFGRKPTIIQGLGILSISTIGIIFSPEIEWLIFFRLIQAIGGGLVVVNASAIVRDYFDGSESASILSNVASITMLAPMVAPLIGSYILKFGDWKTIIFFMLVYAVVLMTVVQFTLKESLQATNQANSLNKILDNYKQVFKSKYGMGYLLAGSFATAGMFTFITKSSYIYMDYFGVSSDLFPYFFGANVLVMILLTKLSARIVKKHSPHTMVKSGLIINSLAGLALLLYTQMTSSPQLHVVLVLNICFIGSLGFIYGNVSACFLSYFPNFSGSANSLFGIIRFTLGSLAGVVVALFGTNIQAPFIVMFLCAAIASVSFALLTPKSGK
ncbi:bicyclomycin/multidrug efflux system [Aureibacter tunicatorum]|nr:bicyclomycin/multidrug efflux system [Aureibacter tunicatorum]